MMLWDMKNSEFLKLWAIMLFQHHDTIRDAASKSAMRLEMVRSARQVFHSPTELFRSCKSNPFPSIPTLPTLLSPPLPPSLVTQVRLDIFGPNTALLGNTRLDTSRMFPLPAPASEPLRLPVFKSAPGSHQRRRCAST